MKTASGPSSNRENVLSFAEQLGMRRSGAASELDNLLKGLDAKVSKVRTRVAEIAAPSGGEIQVLDSIALMPIAEMSRALKYRSGS